MSRLTLSFCALAAIGMAGCATHYDPPPVVRTAPGSPVPAPSASSAWKSGAGVIQTISLGTPSAEDSASAGGTAPSAVTGMGPYRMTLRMDDGSTQVVTQQTTPDFRTGDRVSMAGGMIQH